MEQTAPPWMNIDLFGHLLYHFEKQPITDLENVKLTAKTGINRSKIGICLAETSYASKKNSRAKGGQSIESFTVYFKFCADNAKRCLHFNVELNAYTRVLPELERVLCASGHRLTKIGPRLHSIDKCITLPLIILEDLNSSGWTLPKHRLDKLGMLVLFKKLASFHAASWYLHHEERISFQNYNRGILTSAVEFNYFMDNLEKFIDASKNWPDFYGFQKHIANLPNLFQRQRELLYGKSSGTFKVFNHGNLQPQNIFLKYSAEDQLEDLRFIDFKSCIWASPVVDLMFSLYLLAEPVVILQDKADLIKFYYSEFARNVREMGCLKQIPSLLDLNIDLIRHGFIEIFLSICYLPFEMPRETENQDPFSGNEYQLFIHKQMRHFAHKGYF